MSARFVGYPSARGSASPLRMSSLDVEEGASAGTPVGTLSVARPGSWRFALADDADRRFVLSGDRLLVGTVAPSHAEMPAPRVLVAATDGTSAFARLVTLNVRRRLPALPLPLGTRIALHGDSQSGFNNAGGAGGASVADQAVSSLSYGAVEALFAADPRFDISAWFDPSDPWGRNIAGANQGLFGDHMQWTRPDFGNGIVPRLAHTLALGTPIVILQGGTNSLHSGDDQSGRPGSAAYVVAKLDEALRILRNAGRWCVLETLLPRGDWPLGDGRHAELLQVNEWIRAQAGRSGVLGIWDSWDVLAPGGVIDPQMFLEGAAGIHRNHRGARASALLGAASLRSILAPAIGAGSVFGQDPTVANLLGPDVGSLAGTTGRRIGAATTGAVATGCTLRMLRGGSRQAASKDPVTAGLSRQVLTITPVNDALNGGYHVSEFTLPPLTEGLPRPGAFLQAGLLVEIGDTGSISHTVLEATVSNGAADRVSARALNGTTTTFRSGGPGNSASWVVTKPFQLPADGAFDRIGMKLGIYFPMSAADTPVLRISRPFLRAVPDPRPAWNYPLPLP